MNVVAHGIDIAEVARIHKVWSDHADRFLDRVYTAEEQRYCLDCRTPEVRLAGRFAAKEAILKTLGTGWRGGIEWTDMEILPDPLGRPVVGLANQTAALAQRLGIRQILLSISHAGGFATASAIGLGD